jgi:cytochrome P450
MPGQDELFTFDDKFHQQTHDVLFRSREESPVRRVQFPDGDEAWLVTRYGDVKAVGTDPRVSRDLDGLSALGQPDAADEPGDSPEGEYR